MDLKEPDIYKAPRNTAWRRGLENASALLIKRGTALGPMVPLLFLVPFLVFAAWLFRSSLLFAIPLCLTGISIVVEYCRQYSRFAKADPDRLQSEHYRYEMKRIHMIAAKDFPDPIPASVVHLNDVTTNPAHPLPEVTDAAIAEANKEFEHLT